MSFSSDVKKRISMIKNDCEYCNRAQLAAMVRYTGKIKEDGITLGEMQRSAMNVLKMAMNSTAMNRLGK